MAFSLNMQKRLDMAEILDGKKIASQLKDRLKIKISQFKSEYGRDITLAVILVGENPASQIYVRNKIKSCEYVGVKSLSYSLPSSATENDVVELVKTLGLDKTVDGILVQLPLPDGMNESNVLSAIPPEKDVDGFLPINVGNLLLGNPSTCACTPLGVIKMIDSAGVDISGKHAVVVGRSNIVGKPMAVLLLEKNCTVTVCHSKTKNLKEICLQADVLVSAIGRPKFITGDMIKDGAIVIDVGINRTENGIVGDVDFESASKKASFITPVPGGVGPMTIATLLSNTYDCAVRREKDGTCR